jgi:hypothetical protein
VESDLILVRGVAAVSTLHDFSNSLVKSFSLDDSHFFVNDFSNLQIVNEDLWKADYSQIELRVASAPNMT